nr:mycofactocin-coupled SDR family oxidoreductase [Janibacter alkaliphilus]
MSSVPVTAGPPVAVVAGGARGIGAATARRLADSGRTVVVLDALGGSTLGYPHADAEDLARLAEGGIDGHDVDLRDPGATRAALDAVVAEHGRLDVVVAAASVVAGGPLLWQAPAHQLTALLEADLLTGVHLIQAAVPHLLDRPAEDRPSAVVITSVAGRQGLFGLSGYVIAKHAAVGLVRALAADLAGTAVTAVGVSPGATETEMLAATARIYGLESTAALAEQQHLRAPMDADEVAQVVELAATAGPVVHGAVLDADGGFRRG